MTSLVRALWMLLGVAAAGVLVWLATQPHDQTNAGYWAALGILAGAGLALGLIETVSLRRTRDRPHFSVPVLLLCFVPALIVAGWIIVAGQPASNWLGNHVDNWSGDIGIGGLVDEVGSYVTVLAFGLGLLFGFCFEPAARRETEAAEYEAAPIDRSRAAAGDEGGTEQTRAA